ncbi:MAG: signal peptidase I [Bacteriovorax sp.]|nr:signal peptidase I [Bacteriovorax sp.]
MFKKSTFLIIYFVIAILIGLGIRTYVLSARFVEGDSMSPTIHEGDLVLVNMWSKNFELGNIVIFKTANTKMILIKRIVANPNSAIFIENFKLYRNKILVPEDLQYTLSWDKDAFECRFSNIQKSAANEFLVLGDNRCYSADSRVFGGVPTKNILGKVLINLKLSSLKRAIWSFLK